MKELFQLLKRALGRSRPNTDAVPIVRSANLVSRTKAVDGLVMPAFVYNDQYCLTRMSVFADGLIDCWEMVDLAMFRQKIHSGWVACSVPKGQMINVQGLGIWTIASSQWDLDAAALYEKAVSLIRELNPRMENLHDCHGRTVEVIGGVRTSILGMPKVRPVRRNQGSAFPKSIHGEHISVLVHDDDYYVADLRIFSDGIIELGSLPTPKILNFEGMQRMVEDGTVIGSVPVGARVHLHGLGSFVVEKEHHCADPLEQIREVADLLDRLNGRPDSLERCRAAYSSYLAEPIVAYRDILRAAYEAVPKHNRRYVGDMDTQDIAVRIIIYGEQELENWSHRIVGREIGLEELPTIYVPKPTDGEGV